MSDEPIHVDSRAWTGDAPIPRSDWEAGRKDELFSRLIALALVSAVSGATIVRIGTFSRDPEELRAAFKKRFPRVVITVVVAVIGVLICFATM